MKNEWGKKMYSVLQYKWEKWGSLGNWETVRGGGGCPIRREAEHDMYRWQTVGWSPCVCWGAAQSQCVLCYDVAGPPASVNFIPSLKGSVVTGCVTMCRHTHTHTHSQTGCEQKCGTECHVTLHRPTYQLCSVRRYVHRNNTASTDAPILSHSTTLPRNTNLTAKS